MVDLVVGNVKKNYQLITIKRVTLTKGIIT